MNLIGIPDVFEVINVPGVLYFSIFSKTVFLISNRSTTTSIIQSTSLIKCKSSSKLPVVILFANFLLYIGDGFDFNDVFNASLTNLFRTTLLSNVSFFVFSTSLSSNGTISNKRTSTPILAK